MTETRRPIWTLAWRTGLVAGAIGMIPGLLNSWGTVHGSGRAEIPSTIHILAAIVHAQTYFLIGLLSALVLGWPLRRGSGALHALPLALGVLLVAFTAIGIELNVAVLPDFTSATSLIADLLLAAICGAGAWALYRWSSRRPAPSRFARPWLGLGALLLALSCVAAWAERRSSDQEVPLGEASPELPDILFILVDTIRADHSSAYGYPHPTTPWLERLASEGVVFERAIAASCHTKPSTASIFTSRYPPAHQARRLEETLPSTAFSLTQALRAGGYRAAAFSANGLVSPTFGFGRGFERFFRQEPPYMLLLDLSEILYRAYLGVPVLGKAAGGLLGTFLGWEWVLMPSRRADDSLLQNPEQFEAPGILDAARRWLDEVADDAEHPVFTYVHLLEPHDPYEPPEKLRIEYESRLGGSTDDPYFPHYVGGFLPFKEGSSIDHSRRAGLVARYDAELAAIDSLVGAFVEEARRGTRSRDLMVVFTSDHGEEFYEHKGWGHGHSLYEETVHVPLVLSWPGHLPPGTRVRERVSMIDLAPTLLELIGLPAVPQFQGTSLLPTLAGAGPESRSPVFSEIYWGGHYARSYSEGGRKLIRATSGTEVRTFLYDLAADPGEERNLIDLEPGTEADLGSTLESILKSSEEIAFDARSVRIEGDIADQMRALGYID
ncbi:MAG: hypothetical protein CME06_09410 [Gemmatimonadetes bacterium]|nr:hypothetical protein [Gemmatimonadota bacterium]